MALPTLQPYYITKRSLAAPERVMVRRRVQQDEFKQKWSENSRYFNQTDVEASKQREWTSSKAFQESMGAYQDLIDREEKVVRLRERREKLRRQLEEERALLAAELQALELGPEGCLSHMKARAEDLKGAREEERKKVAHEKLYQQWRVNNPEIRQLEMKEHEKAVHRQWSDQVQDRERRRAEEEHVKTAYHEAMERERREALRKEKEEVTRKKREEKRVAGVLESQMAEIKQREEEAAQMERERAGLLREQAELEEVEKERQQYEEARKKMELGRMLYRQAKAQLRRRSQQVQEELELDLRILEDLAVREAAGQKVLTARKEKARADAEWMRQVVAEQLQLEKEREAQLDTMYQQEAARIWAKRDAEWEKEKQARERLMKEVLAGRQSQIDYKMDLLKTRQAESIERREELLREMEYAKQETARDVQRRKEDITSRERELRSQVMERQRRTQEAREQYERELEEQQEMERAYDELMQAEREVITARGHQPHSHRRTRQAWM